jgi:hypothetical protein
MTSGVGDVVGGAQGVGDGRLVAVGGQPVGQERGGGLV